MSQQAFTNKRELLTKGTGGGGFPYTLGTYLNLISTVLHATPPVAKVVSTAATTNINTASPGASIGGLALSSGQRVLLTGQTAGAENGIWVWNGAAVAMTRPADFAAASDIHAFQNLSVQVIGGDHAGEVWYISTSGAITIDTTSQAWAQVSLAALAGYQPLDSDLTAIAALAPANGTFIKRAGGAWTAAGIVIADISDFGSYQPLDSDLTTLAGLAHTNRFFVVSNGSAYESRAIEAADLPDTYIPTSSLDTDATLAANSDSKVATQKAVKSYVDAVAQGLAPKDAVRLATAAALPACTYANGSSGVGATLTADAVGVLTVDGSTVALNVRVLVKNQSNQIHNGIYLCTTEGTAGVAFVLTRAVDADTSNDLWGAYCFVEAGTANNDKGFVCTNDTAPTIGTDNIVFSQFSGAGQIIAGNNVTKTGDTLSVDSVDNAPIGQSTPAAVKATTLEATGILTAGAAEKHKVRVVTAAGAVTVSATTDFWITVNKSSGAATTVNLPAGATGLAFVIHDGKGDAASNNITIDPDSTEQINGASTLVLDKNFASAWIIWNGTQWDAAILELDTTGGGSAQSVALYEEQQTSGTSGGTFSAGADRTRAINTEVSDPDGIASLSSNDIVIANSGTYLVEWWAEAYVVGAHQTILYDVTGAVDYKRGSTEFSYTSNNIPTTSRGAYIITIAASRTIRLLHRCGSTGTGNGFGTAGSFGTEVYAGVKLTKIA